MIDLLPREAVQQLQRSLDAERFAHSVGVMETAFQLADAWNPFPVDRTFLAWASLFHDCAKNLSRDARHRLLNDGPVPYGQELLEYAKIAHAPLSAKLLQDEYQIRDSGVLMAVAYHPTGHPDLTPIGWMVYIADYLEPGRVYFPKREDYLRVACADPLEGLKLVTRLRMECVQRKNKPQHPLVVQFQQFLENQVSLEVKRS